MTTPPKLEAIVSEFGESVPMTALSGDDLADLVRSGAAFVRLPQPGPIPLLTIAGAFRSQLRWYRLRVAVRGAAQAWLLAHTAPAVLAHVLVGTLLVASLVPLTQLRRASWDDIVQLWICCVFCQLPPNDVPDCAADDDADRRTVADLVRNWRRFLFDDGGVQARVAQQIRAAPSGSISSTTLELRVMVEFLRRYGGTVTVSGNIFRYEIGTFPDQGIRVAPCVLILLWQLAISVLVWFLAADAALLCRGWLVAHTAIVMALPVLNYVRSAAISSKPAVISGDNITVV